MFKEKTIFILKAFRFLLYPLYLISFLIPKKKKLWVFGSHHNRFSENSKALFIYASDKNQDIKAVWISGDKKLCHLLKENGYHSLYRWSLKGIYTTLRAKYYFYNVYSDDINFYTSGNATFVNLWHGIPLKKIEFDDKDGVLNKQFNSAYSLVYIFFKPYIFVRPHYILSSSKIVSQKLASAFRIKENQCLEFSYPRTDLFFNQKLSNQLSQNNLNTLNERILKLKTTKEKIIFYAPTWRSNESNFIHLAIPDFERLNSTLQSINTHFFIKMHPNDTFYTDDYSNIIFIDSKIDINELLIHSDYLLTDYSSVYFDYLLLNKEILFYPFDLNTYLKKERKFYFNYEDVTPGVKIYDFQTLLNTLLHLKSLDYKHERDSLKKELWRYQDENSSQRVYNYFHKMVSK
jgi:CDP-glycerol glycerophosphotransferase (TagB/SpsB family)